MGFETAIFTDVTADEAVDGRDGFNFQSLSEGVGGQEQQRIRESLLHVVSPLWPESRPATEHPETAAFLRDGETFYFSRGRSLGATHNGRRGNQLTQAALTRSADDLGAHRPAQILGAVNWRLEKAASASSETWTAPLELSPAFETEAILELLEDEWVRGVLPSYLTMLEQTHSGDLRPCIIVHRDLTEVLRWMALGTLLLDPEVASRLALRALVPDPFRAGALLVGVSPEFGETARLQGSVIDLEARTVTDITPSAQAEKVARWALSLDGFDALEVIGIGQRWMPVLGVEAGSVGAEMVTGVNASGVGREEWSLGIAAIDGLARAGLTADLELYFDELADAVGSYRLSGAEDFALAARAARTAVDSGSDALADAILIPALECLLAEPQHIGTWLREIDGDGAWRWPSTTDRAAAGAAAGQLVAVVPPELAGAALRWTDPLRAEIGSETLAAATRRAAEAFADDPRQARQTASWPTADEAARALTSALAARLEDPARRAKVFAQLREGEWAWLRPGQPAASETREGALLRSWETAAQIAELQGRQQIELIRAQGSGTVSSIWRYALAETRLPDDLDVWAAWISSVGCDEPMAAEIDAQLRRVMQEPAKSAKVRQTEAWLEFAEVYDRTVRSEESRRLVFDLRAYLEEVPRLSDKAKSAAGRVRGLFGGRRGAGGGEPDNETSRPETAAPETAAPAAAAPDTRNPES